MQIELGTACGKLYRCSVLVSDTILPNFLTLREALRGSGTCGVVRC